MTSDTTLRIWTPLNTVVVVRVPPNSTAAHTLQQLFATSTVAALVLGGLPGHEWDLYANLPLSDDTCTTADSPIDTNINILSVISKLPAAIASRAHLRLACAHPSLTVQVTLSNVPSIDEGRTISWGISHTSTAADVLDGITELYRLPPISMEYTVETVEPRGKHQVLRPLDPSTLLVNVEQRHIRISVPDQWYRRGSPSPPTEEAMHLESTPKQPPPEIDANYASRRSTLAGLFDAWRSPTNDLTEVSTARRWSVSEPSPAASEDSARRTSRLNSHKMLTTSFHEDTNLAVLSPSDELAFQAMMDDIGLKGPRRTAMQELPPDRKLYLMAQNRQMQSHNKLPQTPIPPNKFVSYGPSSTRSLLPKLVPQLTGGPDSVMKRFSISSFTGWGAGSSNDEEEFRDTNPEGSTSRPSSSSNAVLEPVAPQTTGGLFGSWWNRSSSAQPLRSDLTGGPETSQDPGWYISEISNLKRNELKLARHLISLRVHLSTAQLGWIDSFVVEARGCQALGNLFKEFVNGGLLRKRKGDVVQVILLELVKSFRVLLNTDVGYRAVFDSPLIVNCMALSLHDAPLRLRTLVCEVLAALCVLSPVEGEKLVLGAFSEYRIAYAEMFRFEELIRFLKLGDDDEDALEDSSAREGVWEARAATMTLLNALSNCPDDLEERVLIREEFSRRGLNEAIVALRYMRPPEYLLKQLSVYTEEKFEDEEDFRERSLLHVQESGSPQRTKSASGSQATYQHIILLAKRHDAVYSLVIDVLERLAQFLEQNDGNWDHVAVLLRILDNLVRSADGLGDSDDCWNELLSQFLESLRGIVSENTLSALLGSSARQEVVKLRSTVKELSNEVDRCREELRIYSAPCQPPPSSAPSTGNRADGRPAAPAQSVQALVKRLIAKEKQVLQLQTDLDRVSTDVSTRNMKVEEEVRRERDKMKWVAMNEEISKLQSRIKDQEETAESMSQQFARLKTSLVVIHSHVNSRESGDTELGDEMDVQSLEAAILAALDSREQMDIAHHRHISELQSQVSSLLETRAALQMAEKRFKQRVPPPLPPGPTAQRTPVQSTSSSQTNQDFTAHSSSLSPSPLSPPPVLESSPSPNVLIPSPVVPHASEPATSPPPPPPPPPVLPSPRPPSPPPPPPPPSPTTARISAGAFSSAVTAQPPPPPPPPPPPHGSMSVPPLPPPLPDGPRPPSRARSRSGKKLKPFFWNKIAVANKPGNVWTDTPATIEPPVDMNELEDAFSMDQDREKSRATQTSKRQSVTTVLDITRANNVAIMLSRIKLSFAEIRLALLRIDDKSLSLDELKVIARHVPTSDEEQRIRQVQDIRQLAKADQYFYELLGVPHLQERLECMIFRRRLDLDIADIRPELRIVRNAASELRQSAKFKKLLQLVLAVGNALNGSSFRGGARGFRLDALLKLKETKTARSGSDCPTLLHYLARLMGRIDPLLITFIDDLPHLEAAARVSIQTLLASISSVIAGKRAVQKTIDTASAHQPSSEDRFVLTMKAFIDESTDAVDALKRSGDAMNDEVKSTLQYFGESPAEVLPSESGTKPEDFFALVVTFSSDLQRAAEEMSCLPERLGLKVPNVAVTTEEDRPMSELLAENAITPDPSPVSRHGSTIRRGACQTSRLSVGRGDLDQAIRSLRGGQRRHDRSLRRLNKIFLDDGK